MPKNGDMAEKYENSFINSLKGVCHDFVSKHISGELDVFELIWGGFEDVLEDWQRKPKLPFYLSHVREGLDHTLALGARGHAELESGGAIAVLLCVIINLLTKQQQDVIGSSGVGEAVARFASEFLLKPNMVERLTLRMGDLVDEEFPELQASFHEMLSNASAETESIKVRIDFFEDTVTLKKPGCEGTTEAKYVEWHLLEYLLNNPEGKIHWICGFVLFPRWLKRGHDDHREYIRAFSTNFSRMCERLRILGIKIGKGTHDRRQRWWHLPKCVFETNVLAARRLFLRASDSAKANRTDHAAPLCLEALTIYPNHLASCCLLAQCYVEDGFDTASDEQVVRISRCVSDSRTNIEKALKKIDELRRRDDEVWTLAGEEILGFRSQLARLKRFEDVLRTWLDTREIPTEEHRACLMLLERTHELWDSEGNLTNEQRNDRALSLLQDELVVTVKMKVKKAIERRSVPWDEQLFHSHVLCTMNEAPNRVSTSKAELTKYLVGTVVWRLFDDITGGADQRKGDVRTLEKAKRKAQEATGFQDFRWDELKKYLPEGWSKQRFLEALDHEHELKKHGHGDEHHESESDQ